MACLGTMYLPLFLLLQQQQLTLLALLLTLSPITIHARTAQKRNLHTTRTLLAAVAAIQHRESLGPANVAASAADATADWAPCHTHTHTRTQLLIPQCRSLH